MKIHFLKNRRTALSIVLLILLGVPFLIKDNYYLHLIILSGIFTILVSGYNLILGYVGLFSLAHTAWFGIGAYTSALLSTHFGVSFWIGLLAAGIASSFFSYLIGLVTLRLRGHAFILVSFCFAEVIKLICVNWISLTQGPMGIIAIPPPKNIDLYLFSIDFSEKSSFYYLILFLSLVSIYVVSRLSNSRYGRAFIAIRENEDLAKSIGIDTFSQALVAFVVGAFLAGLAGSFYSHYVSVISPELFSFQYMVTILIMLYIGGRGTIAGPVIGALLFTGLPEFLRVSKALRMPIFGLILILAILFMPKGIMQLKEMRWQTKERRTKEPRGQYDISASN